MCLYRLRSAHVLGNVQAPLIRFCCGFVVQIVVQQIAAVEFGFKSASVCAAAPWFGLVALLACGCVFGTSCSVAFLQIRFIVNGDRTYCDCIFVQMNVARYCRLLRYTSDCQARARKCWGCMRWCCLSVCPFVSLSPVKFVKSFARWQHLATSGGLSNRVRYTCYYPNVHDLWVRLYKGIRLPLFLSGTPSPT